MKVRFVLAFATLACLASANGAMGYALEQYDGQAWLAYVLLTIVFEAWAIGRWASFTWPAAIGISVVANFVTAGCCANLCGVGLHSTFVGSRMNPNPLMNMILMFGVLALVSGAIESIVWKLFDRREEERVRDNAWVLRSLAAHLVWVPIGIAIMLIPARPYPFLERYTVAARRAYIVRLAESLGSKIDATGWIPDYRDTLRFFREVKPLDGSLEPDAWTVAYRPDFGRLSTGQTRGEPLWEWNPKASGLKIDSDKLPNSIWLIRIRPLAHRSFGLIWSQGIAHATSDVKSLGYAVDPWY